MCIATRLRRYFVVGLVLFTVSLGARADFFASLDGRGAAIYLNGGYNAYYPAPYPRYTAPAYVYTPRPVYYGNGYNSVPVYYGYPPVYYGPPPFRHHHHHHGHHHHHH